MPDIQKAIETAKQIAADNTHGYDQEERLGNPDYDCSSYPNACVMQGSILLQIPGQETCTPS